MDSAVADYTDTTDRLIAAAKGGPAPGDLQVEWKSSKTVLAASLRRAVTVDGITPDFANALSTLATMMETEIWNDAIVDNIVAANQWLKGTCGLDIA